MHRRAYLAALGSGGLVGLAGCTALGDVGSGLFGEKEEYDVGMTRNAFVPETYEATVGETVVWKNTSSALHTVTAYDDGIPDDAEYFASGGYDSETEAREAWSEGRGGFDTRETFEHTFEVPGRYGYVCLPHERTGMAGMVVVTE